MNASEIFYYRIFFKKHPDKNSTDPIYIKQTGSEDMWLSPYFCLTRPLARSFLSLLRSCAWIDSNAMGLAINREE